MQTLKEEAIEAISKLPESADIDDIRKRRYKERKNYFSPIIERRNKNMLIWSIPANKILRKHLILKIKA